MSAFTENTKSAASDQPVSCELLVRFAISLAQVILIAELAGV